MKIAIALTLAMLLAPKVGIAQAPAAPQWSITNIQLSILKEIKGTFLTASKTKTTVTRSPEKGSIIGIRGTLSFHPSTIPVPDIAGDNVLITGKGRNAKTKPGPHIAIPDFTLTGITGEQGETRPWLYEPIAVAFDGANSCDTYYFLDSKSDISLKRDVNGATVGLDISGGKVRISSRVDIPMCFAFPAPASRKEMYLQFSGKRMAIEEKTASSPVVLFSPMPAYPGLARTARVQGTVILQATVAVDGTVKSLSVVSSSSPLLLPGVVDTVKTWRYQPNFANGAPAEFTTTITIPFSLK